MSENEEIISITIPERGDIAEIVDFIENELQPPSRLKWMLIFFAMGLMGGIGLGVFIAWLR